LQGDKTALHYAASKGNLRVVEQLLRAGAAVDAFAQVFHNHPTYRLQESCLYYPLMLMLMLRIYSCCSAAAAAASRLYSVPVNY
jgi:ankyrin repeat protein